MHPLSIYKNFVDSYLLLSSLILFLCVDLCSHKFWRFGKGEKDNTCSHHSMCNISSFISQLIIGILSFSMSLTSPCIALLFVTFVLQLSQVIVKSHLVQTFLIYSKLSLLMHSLCWGNQTFFWEQLDGKYINFVGIIFSGATTQLQLSSSLVADN